MLVIVAAGALAVLSTESARSFEECWLKAPVERRYRVEPEEETVVLETLVEHFKRHPSFRVNDLCIAGPGHAALRPDVRDRLRQAGLSLEARANCRYEVERDLWSADGAWRIDEKTFVVQITRSRFSDVSTWQAAYEYRLAGAGKIWAITSEKTSPCNPIEAPVEAQKP
jgi:hypothetical protein